MCNSDIIDTMVRKSVFVFEPVLGAESREKYFWLGWLVNFYLTPVYHPSVISTEGMYAFPTMKHSMEWWGSGEQMDETKMRDCG